MRIVQTEPIPISPREIAAAGVVLAKFVDRIYKALPDEKQGTEEPVTMEVHAGEALALEHLLEFAHTILQAVKDSATDSKHQEVARTMGFPTTMTPQGNA